MSFLKNYLKYNEGNETPKDYVLWSALSILSTAAELRFAVDLEQFHITPHLYVLLVGMSGDRKTFAILKAKDMLVEAVGLDLLTLSGSKETHQGIISTLHKKDSIRMVLDHRGQSIECRPYTILSFEFASYFAIDPIGMINFLTDIYDQKVYTYRLKNEDQFFANPYVTILGGCVPRWLATQMKNEIFCEGFSRRAILVYSDEVIYLRPTLTPEMQSAWNACVKRIQEIRLLNGTFILDNVANEWFWGKWYGKWTLPSDDFMRAWQRSKHIALFKIAMLASLSEKDDLVLTINYLHYALELLEKIEKFFPLLTNQMGRGELSGPANTILQYLRSKGGFELEVLVRKDLLLRNFKSPIEFWQVVETLKKTDQLREVRQPVNGSEKLFLALPECIKIEPKQTK